MRFWDSSAVVPLLVTQPGTAAAQELLSQDSDILVWWVTPVECVSAVARLERDGELDSDSAEQALSRLSSLSADWAEAQPVEAIRRSARRLLRVHPLRAADALQLGAAIVASEGDPGSLDVVTLDDRLRDAGRREGFTVLSAT